MMHSRPLTPHAYHVLVDLSPVISFSLSPEDGILQLFCPFVLVHKNRLSSGLLCRTVPNLATTGRLNKQNPWPHIAAENEIHHDHNKEW